jgi:hypothetical protein
MTVRELIEELEGSRTAYKVSCVGERVLVSTDSVSQALVEGRA